MRGLVIFLFFAGSLPLCFFRPFYGILIWMVVAFLNPQDYMWGFSGFPVGVAVGIATLGGMLIFERGWVPRLFTKDVLIIVLLWFWFTITTFVSTNTAQFVHHAADTWFKWGEVSKILLMTLATIVLVRSREQLRILLLVIGLCFGLLVLKVFPFIVLTGGAFRVYGPENSMVADNNDFGLALVMTFPIFFYLAQTEASRWVKRFAAFLCLITVPAIFFTYSRGALAGLVVVLVMIFMRSKRQALLLLPILLVGGVLSVTYTSNAWKDRMTSDFLDASALSRVNAWKFCWALASDSPVTGGGFATFTAELFNRYAPNAQDVHNSHSIYFGVLAEHGFVGLFIYAALLFMAFHTARRVAREAVFRGDVQALRYANMLRFSVIGFMVSGMFLSRAYFDYFYTIIACIGILHRVCREEWAEVESAEVEEVVAS